MKSNETMPSLPERILRTLEEERQTFRYFKELDRGQERQIIEVVLRDAGVNRSIF